MDGLTLMNMSLEVSNVGGSERDDENMRVSNKFKKKVSYRYNKYQRAWNQEVLQLEEIWVN